MLLLAEKIGGRTADELASVMSLSEFAEWAEYIRLEHKEIDSRTSRRGPGKGGGKIGRKR